MSMVLDITYLLGDTEKPRKSTDYKADPFGSRPVIHGRCKGKK